MINTLSLQTPSYQYSRLLLYLWFLVSTHAYETVQCSFVHKVAHDGTSFDTTADCAVPYESTLHWGDCLWDLSFTQLSGGAYLVRQQYTFHQESNTDCGCVKTLSGTLYEQTCAIYLTLGSSDTILQQGTVISRWTTAFEVGSPVLLNVSFPIVVDPGGPAQLPVDLKLYEDETFLAHADPLEPRKLGQLLYYAVGTSILGTGELHIDHVTICNLENRDAKGALCGDLFALDYRVVSTLNDLETRMVSVLNLPYTVIGVWYLHVTGVLKPLSGRRLLQTGITEEKEQERPFRQTLAVWMGSPDTTTEPIQDDQGVQFETVAVVAVICLLGMGGALGGSYYMQRRAWAGAKAASNMTNVSATQAQAPSGERDLAESGLGKEPPPLPLSSFVSQV